MSYGKGNLAGIAPEIEALRDEINDIDSKLLELIAERRRVSRTLGEQKTREGAEIRDPKREREVLHQRSVEARAHGLDSFAVTRIFREIISDSLAIQEKSKPLPSEAASRVAYLGVAESDAAYAISKIFPDSTRPRIYSGMNAYDDLARLLASGEVDEVLVPFEHSEKGVFEEAFQFLSANRCTVLGEEKISVESRGFLRLLLLSPKEAFSKELLRTGFEKQPGTFPLARKTPAQSSTIIDVKGVRIGGGDFVVIAGPCSVESYEQIMTCAREVHRRGGLILRGGCFKSRTSPYSFQGLGFEGLEYLVDAGKAFELPVITEVLAPEDVERVAACADILQIGARNMQNFALLKAVGRAARPVVLKRGMSSSIDELLLAVEYILAHGNSNVIICERGIRTFETRTRSTLDISAIPILKRETHLPVIVDPSHAAGDRDLVPALALAAKAVGADGIMVEIHPEPEKALSDGPQSLRFSQFESLMGSLRTEL